MSELGCLEATGSTFEVCLETCAESFSCPARMATASSCDDADSKERCL